MKPRIHLICNAHLDPVWLWEWEEGAAEAISTFRVAAELCEADYGFIFNHNEAVLYQWVEEYEPSLFARLQELVRAGKGHVMGGWFLQPDCNMPSGESFVRQIVVGRQYFRDRFGVEPTTALNLDPFGHTRGLVQLLAKSGYDSYLFCRPAQHDCPLPNYEFRWVGYDGSEVLASRCLDWCNSPLGKARQKVEHQLADFPAQDFCYLLWGVGNHGGGPSKKDVEDLTALIAETTDFEIRHSTPEAYFAELACKRDTLPTHAKDLNSWAPGCYTSQVRIKQRHRLLENELYSRRLGIHRSGSSQNFTRGRVVSTQHTAVHAEASNLCNRFGVFLTFASICATEKMVTTAALQGLTDYPRADLATAERDLVFSEFHDILPGSSIQPVEDMSLRGMDHGLEILSRVKARAFFALASGQPKAREGEIPVLVYNPHPFKVKAVVECEFQLPDQNHSGTFVNFAAHQNGKPLPSQVEKELSNIALDWRKRLAFTAELQPSQMNRFDCLPEVLPAKPKSQLKAVNGRLRLLQRRAAPAPDALARLLSPSRRCQRDPAARPVLPAYRSGRTAVPVLAQRRTRFRAADACGPRSVGQEREAHGAVFLPLRRGRATRARSAPQRQDRSTQRPQASRRRRRVRRPAVQPDGEQTHDDGRRAIAGGEAEADVGRLRDSVAAPRPEPEDALRRGSAGAAGVVRHAVATDRVSPPPSSASASSGT